jgi:hypothetical protein
MPCVALARGMRQSAPHTGVAFNDTTDNNPCGRPAMLTVTGQTGVAAENLCMFHWIFKHGQQDYVLPVTKEP